MAGEPTGSFRHTSSIKLADRASSWSIYERLNKKQKEDRDAKNVD